MRNRVSKKVNSAKNKNISKITNLLNSISLLIELIIKIEKKPNKVINTVNDTNTRDIWGPTFLNTPLFCVMIIIVDKIINTKESNEKSINWYFHKLSGDKARAFSRVANNKNGSIVKVSLLSIKTPKNIKYKMLGFKNMIP